MATTAFIQVGWGEGRGLHACNCLVSFRMTTSLLRDKLDVLLRLPRSETNVAVVGRQWLASGTIRLTPGVLDTVELALRRYTIRELTLLGRPEPSIMTDILPYIVSFVERWKSEYRLPPNMPPITLERMKNVMALPNNKLDQTVVSSLLEQMMVVVVPSQQ